MARFFFSLSWCAGVVSLAILGAPVLCAQSMVPPPTNAAVHAPVPTPAATPPAKPAAPPAVIPPAVPDSFNRYGKIWAPSDDVDYPLKLSGHFPGVSEIRIPTQDDLADRDKLEQLAMLSDTEIRAQLEQWPPYTKMKLGDQGQMLLRIQQFKEQRTKIAMDKAHDLGILNSLTPDQKVHFEKDYWDTRRQMDHDEVKQIEPILKTWQQKLEENLFRKYSSAGTAVPAPPAPAPKPPGAPPAPGKSVTATAAPKSLAPSSGSPVAQNPVR